MVKHAANPNQRLFDLFSQEKLSAKELSAEVRRLLAANPKGVHATDDHGNTPLICALKHGEVELAEEFIAFGADINAVNGCGQTALMAAAENGLSELCALLVERTVDRDACDDFGGTALMSAIGFGHASICPVLLPCKAIDSRHRDGYTALLLASFAEDIETCRLLINHGATISEKDWEAAGVLKIGKRRIERLVGRPAIGKRQLFASDGRLRDEVLFAAADCRVWDKLFAVLRKDWNLFEEVWDCFGDGLRERLRDCCADLSQELRSREVLEQVKKARGRMKGMERPDDPE